MLILSLFLVSLICSSRSSISCPNYYWTGYKNYKSGPWLFNIPNNDNLNASIFIRRYTEYRCFNETHVEFHNVQNMLWEFDKSDNYYSFSGTKFQRCNHECDSRNETVKVSWRDRKKSKLLGISIWSKWSEWSELGEFVYLNKNCDKLFWTSWIEISNCSTSSNSIYARQCVDCDGELANARYCAGNQSMKCECQYAWSDWATKETCNVTNCNSTGKRIKRRVCLYGEGNKTADVQFCRSYSHESNVMMEQCDVDNFPGRCQPHWNEWSKAGPCVVIGCNSTGQQARRRKCLYGDGSEAPNMQMCSNQSSIIIEYCSDNVGTFCDVDSRRYLFSVPVVVCALILLIALLRRKQLRGLFSKCNQKQTPPEQNRPPNEDQIYEEIRDSDRIVEPQKQRGQANINVETPSGEIERSNRNPNGNDEINADQVALLPNYDTPKNINQSNSKTNKCYYEIPTDAKNTVEGYNEVAANASTEYYDVIKRI